MWVERVLRRGFDAARDAEGRAVDYLDLLWDECRRVVKGTTRGGEPVRVLLPAGEAVRHGDVLRDDPGGVVVVNVRPCEVVVATPLTFQQAAELALRLGNLHHPTQVGEAEIAFIAAGPALAAAAEAGVGWTVQQRVFEPGVIETTEGPTLASGFAVIRSGEARGSSSPG